MEDNYSLDICAHTIYNFEVIEMDLVRLFHAIYWLCSCRTHGGTFWNAIQVSVFFFIISGYCCPS